MNRGAEVAPMRLTVGQEVRVFDVNGRRMGYPDEGKVGHVVKVGRKLVTISTGEGRWSEQQFRIDEQRANDNYGHQWFRTLEEHALDERRRHAIEKLNAHKVMLDAGHALTLEQIEALASVLTDADDIDDDDRLGAGHSPEQAVDE